MRYLKQLPFTILWLILVGLTAPFLAVSSLIALLRGRQQQYFAQKPIFDLGKQNSQ